MICHCERLSLLSKCSSVTRVVSRTSIRGQRHGYRARTPKRRFSVKDRSVSSPRLKSFPAEKIRRTERSPIRKTPENTDLTNPQIIQSGQGDVPANFQNPQSLRESPIGNENITSTSEQQVPQNVCPIENRLNQSELVIPSSGIAGTTVERPQHRPYVQQPSTQQQRYQQQEIAGQTAHQQTNNVKVDQNDQNKQFQSPLQANVDQHGISGGTLPAIQHRQEEPVQHHHHHHHQQNEISGQTLPQSLNAVKLEGKQKIDGAKKKPLKFTPAMIRDQEVLVMTMRQQGIKEDIMRRQFDALLAEQRKQLLYLEQLENPATNETGETPQARRVKRRITRIDEDEKPDWMLHITPPRIPHSVLEKMRAERQAELQGTLASYPNVLHTRPAQQSNNQRNEIYDSGSHAHQQHPWQTNAPTGCQHHPQYSHISNNINVPRENHAATCQYQQRGDARVANHQQQSYNPNMERQLMSHNCQMHPTETKRCEESVRGSKTIEPSSLLKLRIYKEVIKRQKQNNGLQDPEAIKEAMEALKNPANRPGLEYLENLNKKRDKPVPLNGVQDPNEIPMSNRIPSYVCQQPPPRGPSANGLENTRNPNNPPPRDTLRLRKIDDLNVSEYPRQRITTNNLRNCYSLMAEREDGTVAVTKNHQAQNGTSENPTSCTHHSHIRSDYPNYQYPSHMQPAVRCNEKSPANYMTSPNEQPHHYPQYAQGRCENMEKIRNRIDAEISQDRTLSKQGFSVEDKSNKNQQRDLSDPRKNYGIYEPVIIGGLKYLARKPQYCQNGTSLQQCQGNLGRGFNPMVACQ